MTATITLTPTQRALIGLSRRLDDPRLIHLSYAIVLTGALDQAALEKAMKALTDRHAELRLADWSTSGSVELLPSARPALIWEAAAPRDWQVWAAERSLRFAGRPFDLEREAPLRAAVIPLGDSRHLLLFCGHHAVADGWGLDLAAREISELYASHLESRAPRLGSAPSTMLGDEDAAWLSSGEAAEARTWWRAMLSATPAEAFAADSDAQPDGLRTLAHAVRAVPESVSRAAEQTARWWHVPVYPLLVGVSAAVVGDFLSEGRLVIGATAANRSSPASARSLSARYNTLLVALDTVGSLEALTHRAHVSLLEAYDRQRLPFAEIAAMASAMHGFDPHGLPGVSILYDRYPLAALRLAGIDAQPLMRVDGDGRPAPRVGRHLSPAHLIVFWRHGGGRLTLTVFADPARHGTKCSARIAAFIAGALAAALDQPDQPIARAGEPFNPAAALPDELTSVEHGLRLAPCAGLFPVEALSPVPWLPGDEARA